MNELIYFSLDTENGENNFNLARWYESQGHTAPAHTYYLRCAERTDDTVLAYSALIRASFCYRSQGSRDATEKVILENALMLMPERPEAYYFLSLLYEKKQEWQNSYIYSTLGLKYDISPLKSIPEYSGKHLLIFQKSTSSWWWGKSQEARDLLKLLVDEYWEFLSDDLKNIVQNNISKLGITKYSQAQISYTKKDYSKLRYKFPGAEIIEENYSQVFQDMFVLSMLNGKKNGTFLEIGGAKPFERNNTALLEEKFGWNGVSIELDKTFTEEYISKRPNIKVINENALDINYEKLLKENFNTKVVDYLQLDIEPANNTYECMLKIPFDEYKFAVITYEHDYYIDVTKSYRDKSRKFLRDNGYVLVANDISPEGKSTFEDWWVHPDLVDNKILDIMMDTSDKIKKINEYILNTKFYAEFETDRYLRENFFSDYSYKGTMVEVGAGPPTFISTSKHFRDSGWRTICVEPNPKFVAQHRNCGSEVYQYACSSSEGKSNFIVNLNNDEWYTKENDGVSFSALEIKYNGVPDHNTQEVIEVEKIKLDTLLDKINVNKIDILSIDVEGWEIDVLKGFNYIKYSPKVIVLENFENNVDYEKYMNSIGYIKKDTLGYNEIYTKNIDKINLDSIDWGLFNYNSDNIRDYKNHVKLEISNNVYTKIFDIQENDVVFDIGSSVGVFTLSILNKNPKEVHCFEPRKELFNSMKNNLHNYSNVKLNCLAIGNTDSKDVILDNIFKVDHYSQDEAINNKVDTIKFNTYIKDNNIKKIDFLKVDCEGGEWDIFTEENYNWISKNVSKVSGEFHLFDESMKKSFILFRDLYLKNNSTVKAFNVNRNGELESDITSLIWDNNFVIYNLNYLNMTFDLSESLSKNNIFKINELPKNTAWCVDNFYENPDEVRNFALNQEYFEGGIGRGFIGRRTKEQFLFPGLKEKFENIMGKKITAWEEHDMNGRFQVSWSGEPLVYHCDSQKWGGMLYLTPEAPYQCGTTLYAHKKTKARTYYDKGWDAAWIDTPGDCHLDGTHFEPVDVLGNVYNRLVIFDASCIHSASEYFGTIMENARLWQMFFFDTE